MSDLSLFKWRHFQADIILCAGRWYLRYVLSHRDVEELLKERGVTVDHMKSGFVFPILTTGTDVAELLTEQIVRRLKRSETRSLGSRWGRTDVTRNGSAQSFAADKRGSC
jgi:hypothetical protein